MVSRLLLRMLHFYKRSISPGLGSHCRFIPTCSEYMMEAIELHGAFKGVVLGLYRILRCNPLCKGGYDPVPPKKK
ncbi:MAG: membrane protein insertion efficiency factor YidD [Oscillospiraceae bacterium]